MSWWWKLLALMLAFAAYGLVEWLEVQPADRQVLGWTLLVMLGLALSWMVTRRWRP